MAAEIGASYCHVDVSNATAWRDLMVKVMDAHGRLDVLVNNAAVHWFRSIEEETVEDFDRLMGVNLRGHSWESRRPSPRGASGGGSIINIASIAGHPRPPAPCFLRSFEVGDPWPHQDSRRRARAERNPGQRRASRNDRFADGMGRRAHARRHLVRPLAAWTGGSRGRGGSCGGLPRLECFRVHHW